MNILSQEFNQFLSEIIENEIVTVWLSTEENNQNNYGVDYAHCNHTGYRISKHLIIQTKKNKYYELMPAYSNAEYALEINELKIDSIKELTTFYDQPIEYSKFKLLRNLRISAIKPDVQCRIIEEVNLRSISFYSENKFEFGLIGRDNLDTHKELDRPPFDGCWLVLDKNIIEMYK